MVITKFYPLFLLTTACTIICIIMLIVVVLHLVCGCDICLTNVSHDENENIIKIKIATKPMKWVQYLSILSLLSFVICLLSELWIIHSLDKDFNIPDNQWQQNLSTAVNTISWGCGQLFIYSLFVTNLYYTFKNTLLQLSKFQLRLLIFLIISFFILQLSFAVLYSIYYMFIIGSEIFGLTATIIISATEFVDLIISVMLVYIFLNRLFKLFVLSESHNISSYQQNNYKKTNLINIQEDEEEDAYDDDHEISVSTNTYVTDSMSTDLRLVNEYNNINFNNPSSDIISDLTIESLNIKQRSILNTASKYAILSCIAIVSTQIFLIAGVNNCIAINASQQYYDRSFQFYSLFFALDCFLNSLCIVLNFEFNKIWFQMICCLCDGCCHSICKKLSKRYAYDD